MAPPALSQNKEISESDKAIFAFFKLTRGVPAYEKWVRESEQYLSAAADPVLQKEVFETEILRLKWGFGTYNLDSDFIKIRTAVKMILRGENGHEKISFLFPHTAQDHIPYFPFPYGEEWIALVVNDLGGASLDLPLTPEEAGKAAALLPANTPVDGQITLQIRPVKADNTQPLKLDGADQWLMMGETGYYELSYQGTVLGSYMADWYLTDTEKQLLPLLKK